MKTLGIKKVLVANRGEIACRIIRTLSHLSIASVAIYSDTDIDALHVKLADEAYNISGIGTESYLNISAIIDIAKNTGCHAIHPGYGFLSENAKFAQACMDTDIIFIGPSAKVIEQMGDKATAKTLAKAAGVPIIPGYYGEEQNLSTLSIKADEIGYPLLIKPTHGGGGKGMEIVHDATTFKSQCESTQRLAKRNFGNDQLMLEKYFPKARHIEVQVFGDSHGNVIHLFERECSVQRRYQKIIEEAPAPHLDRHLRDALTKAATRIAKQIGYQGAGTVEFLVAEHDFYFMEMNTRLQVEHPVTEMTTGIDLVAWQLIIAAGKKIPLSQSNVCCHGHAIEARLYAENPVKQFMPATGHVHYLHYPEENNSTRIDNGIQLHDEITVHYDPLLAKLIAHGENRKQAIQILKTMLTNTHLLGVTTNRDFLRKIVDRTEFKRADIDTQFIDAHEKTLITNVIKDKSTSDIMALAAAYCVQHETALAQASATLADEPNSPWALADNWRLGEDTTQIIRLNDVEVAVQKNKTNYFVTINQTHFTITEPAFEVVIEDKKYLYILHKNEIYIFSLMTTDTTHQIHHGNESIQSPLPGTVVKVAVKPNDQVKSGDTLMVIEAMKMEHTLTAPGDGTVKIVHFQVGDQVEEGTSLVELYF